MQSVLLTFFFLPELMSIDFTFYDINMVNRGLIIAI